MTDLLEKQRFLSGIKALTFFIFSSANILQYRKPNGEILLTINDGYQYNECRFEYSLFLSQFDPTNKYELKNIISKMYDVIDSFVEKFVYKKKFLMGNVIVLHATYVSSAIDKIAMLNDELVKIIQNNNILDGWLNE